MNYLPTCTSRLVVQHLYQVSFKSMQGCRRSWEDKLWWDGMTEGRNDGRTDKANTKCPLAILWRGHKNLFVPMCNSIKLKMYVINNKHVQWQWVNIINEYFKKFVKYIYTWFFIMTNSQTIKRFNKAIYKQADTYLNFSDFVLILILHNLNCTDCFNFILGQKYR